MNSGCRNRVGPGRTDDELRKRSSCAGELEPRRSDGPLFPDVAADPQLFPANRSGRRHHVKPRERCRRSRSMARGIHAAYMCSSASARRGPWRSARPNVTTMGTISNAVDAEWMTPPRRAPLNAHHGDSAGQDCDRPGPECIASGWRRTSKSISLQPPHASSFILSSCHLVVLSSCRPLPAALGGPGTDEPAQSEQQARSARAMPAPYRIQLKSAIR
nr:hypothetical protein CFP56_54855 [Quercus suber]